MKNVLRRPDKSRATATCHLHYAQVPCAFDLNGFAVLVVCAFVHRFLYVHALTSAHHSLGKDLPLRWIMQDKGH
ncbi:MAG: hypothetical protein ABIT92_01445 [Gammaproteobacteria bacterium]